MNAGKKAFAFLLSLSLFLGMGACNFFNGSDSDTSSESNIETTANYKIVLKRRKYTLFLNSIEDALRIEANVYENGALIENAELDFSVEDESVTEIDKDGKLLPKGAGKTTVMVTYSGAQAKAEVSVIGEASAEQVNAFEEEYVNTYGRVYKKADKLCLDYVGAGVGVAINGSSLTANIEVDTAVYLCVYVDGAEEYERVKLMPTQKEYTLVSGLTEGFHTVRLVKSSEVYDGQIRLLSLASEGFYTAPEKSDLRIEFIGDSITAGYGVLGSPGKARTVENSDACSSYAYYAAQKLEADYSVVAIQGICVKANMWLNEAMCDVYKYVSPLNRLEYDFTYDPDVVVLNLGTNDGSYVGQNYDYSEVFPEDYLEFLRYIREKNPNAYILCIYGMMGKQSAVDRGINTAIAAMQDDKVVRLDGMFIQNTLGANGHPAQEAQKEWGETLAEYIKNTLKL